LAYDYYGLCSCLSSIDASDATEQLRVIRRGKHTVRVWLRHAQFEFWGERKVDSSEREANSFCVRSVWRYQNVQVRGVARDPVRDDCVTPDNYKFDRVRGQGDQQALFPFIQHKSLHAGAYSLFDGGTKNSSETLPPTLASVRRHPPPAGQEMWEVLWEAIGQERKKAAESEAAFWYLAERVGFEPTVRLHARLISSQVHSTTLPPLRACCGPQVDAGSRMIRECAQRHNPTLQSGVQAGDPGRHAITERKTMCKPN
jgi:hypothetical protein